MRTSRVELSVGVFVLAGLGALGWLAIKAGGGALTGRTTYTLTARFGNSSGLSSGSTISIAGVPVGKVQAVKLDEHYAAIAELRLHQDVRLPTDTIASIKTNGLLGDKYIALAPGADTEIIPPGGKITETESALDLESLLSRFAFGSVQNGGTPGK